MFSLASLRLAAWYLTILMAISLLFSALVYQSALSEVAARLAEYDARLEASGYQITDYQVFQSRQLEQARHNILITLGLVNGTIALAGGVASFFLARRTLKPIEEVHETQRRFVGDASHELRTPLAIMKAEIELALSDRSVKKAELLELLRSNLDEVDRLSEMSRMLLSLSRHEYQDLKFDRLDIKDVIKNARVLTDRKGRIDIKANDKPLFVRGNRASLEELFSILFDNALKYSPKGSKVEVKARSIPTAIAVSVTNRGRQIPKTDLDRLFDRFYRGSTARPKDGGFGLGLAIAKQITDLHKGSIHATSDNRGRTTVVLSLPQKR